MLMELIRHGETALQQEHRYQGITDAPLSPAGKAALHPAGYIPDVLVVTKLRRTGETAEILFPGVQQRIVPGLAEMNFGVFEGRSYLEMAQDRDYREWVDGMCTGKCPGGESKGEFCARVCLAFSELMEALLAENVQRAAIVAHGGTQMAVLERYALPKKDYFDWHFSSGQGCLLDAAAWEASHTLMVLGTTDYTKD